MSEFTAHEHNNKFYAFYKDGRLLIDNAHKTTILTYLSRFMEPLDTYQEFKFNYPLTRKLNYEDIVK